MPGYSDYRTSADRWPETEFEEIGAHAASSSPAFPPSRLLARNSFWNSYPTGTVADDATIVVTPRSRISGQRLVGKASAGAPDGVMPSPGFEDHTVCSDRI